jgi:flagellar protein FlgJ
MDGISSIYTSQYLDTTDSATTNKVESSLDKDYSNSSDDELMSVCKQFESYFVEQMYKAMKKMVPEEEDESTSGTSMLDCFEDTLTQEYASITTERGDLGIAQTLYEQMKRNYNL